MFKVIIKKYGKPKSKVIFYRIFKANMRLEVFYNLLVKEITEGGGITASDKPEQASGFMENRKDVLELSQKFSGKTNFFFSYVFRSILEILLAAGLLVFLCIVGLPTVLDVSISDISINYFDKAQKDNIIISLKPSSHIFIFCSEHSFAL